MKEPSPIGSRLGFLTGRFAGRDRVHETVWAPGGDASARAEGSPGADGRVLVRRHTDERDGQVTFEALDVLMVDPVSGALLLYGFDSVGYPPDPPARGDWHGEVLVLERRTARGSSRTTYAPTADGYRWRKEFQAPGTEGWATVVEGELHRED
jgi:hypothetical protein